MMKHRIWHPFVDPYHCCFRILTLLEEAPQNIIELNRMRFLDLFLLFPSLLHKMTMPKTTREKFRALGIIKPEKNFMSLPDQRILYRRLITNQRPAISQLFAAGFINSEMLKKNQLQLNRGIIPAPLHDKILKKIEVEKDMLQFLIYDLAHIKVGGSDGLFDRFGMYRGTNG